MELLQDIKSNTFKEKTREFVLEMSDAFTFGGSKWKLDENAQTLAEALAESAVEKSQVRLLLDIAQSSGSIADIFDAIKVRIARDYQKRGWNKEGLGRQLISILSSLRTNVDEFISKDSSAINEGPDLARRIHLLLCREFLKHLAAHFEYIKAEKRGLYE